MSQDFLGNQPLEVAYALFRVAEFIKHKDLRSRIESLSINFIEATAEGNPESSLKNLQVLERLVLFGETIGEIHFNYSKVLFRQFSVLRAAIRQMSEAKTAEFDIQKIFSSGNADRLDKPAGKSVRQLDSRKDIAASVVKETSQASHEEDDSTFVEPMNGAKDRQTQVLERIRQSGSLAMKDLISAFPHVSERTLRYDLQKLCDQLIIERVGNGGPASYYRMRDISGTRVAAALRN